MTCLSCCLNACCFGQLSQYTVLVLTLAFWGLTVAESLSASADPLANYLDVLDKSKQELGTQCLCMSVGQGSSGDLPCILGLFWNAE